MYLNNKHVQIVVGLYDENGEGPNFYFETPSAVETFVNGLSEEGRYKGYEYQITYTVDGKDTGSFSADNLSLEEAFPDGLKAQMLCSLLGEACVQSEVGDAFFPLIYLVIEYENGREIFRYADRSLMKYDWCDDFMERANEHLKAVEASEFGELKVYVDVAPSDNWNGQYIVKSDRRVLISEGSVKELDYSDMEAIILASVDMFDNGYYDLLDDLYWFSNKEAESYKANIFGEGYKHSITFYSATDDSMIQCLEYAELSRCIVEDGSASILEAVNIPFSESSSKSDAAVKATMENEPGGDKTVVVEGNIFTAMMRTSNNVTDEELIGFGDFITVIADKKYVESSLLEDEVIPLAERFKVVIIYTDEARFTPDRLNKLPSYRVFAMDDTERSEMINAYLALNEKG